MNKETLYKHLISKYGDKQLLIAIEEMSELQKELVKCLRGSNNNEAVLEELADATIMLEQVRRYFDIRPIELLAKKKDKLNRQWEREGL